MISKSSNFLSFSDLQESRIQGISQGKLRVVRFTVDQPSSPEIFPLKHRPTPANLLKNQEALDSSDESDEENLSIENLASSNYDTRVKNLTKSELKLISKATSPIVIETLQRSIENGNNSAQESKYFLSLNLYSKNKQSKLIEIDQQISRNHRSGCRGCLQ